jgi:hypothetical protein
VPALLQASILQARRRRLRFWQGTEPSSSASNEPATPRLAQPRFYSISRSRPRQPRLLASSYGPEHFTRCPLCPSFVWLPIPANLTNEQHLSPETKTQQQAHAIPSLLVICRCLISANMKMFKLSKLFN